MLCSVRMVYAMDIAPIRGEWEGRVVDAKYPLLQWLGGSHPGGVFLTELRGPGSQKAALKLIPAGAPGADARVAGWTAAAPLSHPHLMGLFHSGSWEFDNLPLLYAVTEFAEENLAQVLLERPLTPDETGEMLRSVLDVLAYLHGRGFMHGHLKPSNIMVVDDQLRISSDNLHVAGEPPGQHSPAPGVYEAPEAATQPISPAADLWSLGVTLVAALTQHPPERDRSTQSELMVPESIPQPFAAIARGCLRTDPQSRLTISQIKALLDPAKPLPAPAPLPSPPSALRSKPAPVRFRWAPILAAVVFVALAVGVAFMLRSHRPESSPSAENEEAASGMKPSPAKRQGSAPMAKPSPAGSEEPAPANEPSPSVEGEQAAPAPAPPQPSTPAPAAGGSSAATAKGAVTVRALPEIPEKAEETIHGSFELSIRVEVDPGGNVSNAAVDSQGPSHYFANLALEAARKWKFNPPLADGQPVASVWVLRFRFSRSGIEVAPTEVSP